jgi:pimeloyl-ACP methyl ester carboxylesterase
MNRVSFLLIALLAFFTACAAGSGAKPEPASETTLRYTTACKTCSNVTPQQKVILVHGRGDSPARWDTLVTNWSSKGFTENVNLFRIDLAAYCTSNTFCAMLPAPDGTGATYVNESYAKCLKRYVDEKVPCDSDAGTCPAVDIVTHSQGGIVARYYARFLAAPRQVNDLVVMAAPNNGITNCTLAGSCQGVNPEDCPDSAFMRKLNGVSPQGDGTNDETPGASQLGPVHYDAILSTGDKTVVPWCTAYFILNPQTQQGDDLSCSGAGNYTLDTEADSCKLSNIQHLVVPTNATAINHAYCQVTAD